MTDVQIRQSGSVSPPRNHKRFLDRALPQQPNIATIREIAHAARWKAYSPKRYSKVAAARGRSSPADSFRKLVEADRNRIAREHRSSGRFGTVPRRRFRSRTGVVQNLVCKPASVRDGRHRPRSRPKQSDSRTCEASPGDVQVHGYGDAATGRAVSLPLSPCLRHPASI